MGDYSRQEAAERAGVSLEELNQLVELEILAPRAGDRFTEGDVRRLGLVHSLLGAGIPMDGLAAAVVSGELSLAFIDDPVFERFASLTRETFQELANRSGISVDLLMVVREAIGSAQPNPDDRVREDELAILPFIELQFYQGFRPIAIERFLRVMGESLRRVAETEGEWWFTEVVEPRVARGMTRVTQQIPTSRIV